MKDIKATDSAKNYFSGLKSYSVEEVIAAGGTTAFANKVGKGDIQTIIDHLKELPKDAFLTEEDVEAILKDLRENK